MASTIQRGILQGWDVVVIDDEPDSLDVAARILRYYSASVHTASNGAEGLALIRKIRPRFVISDLSMPVMDGWEMIKYLKQDRSALEMPIIALTAHAMVGDRERAISAGFHNYLTKPLNPATFIGDVLSLLMDVPHLASQLRDYRA
jgi:two-component system cell cycle response regulator